MNRRKLLRSAAALPAVGTAFAVAAAQQKQMKITGVETDLLKPPPGPPFYDALQTLNVDKGSVVLRIRTDAGITGWASSSFGNGGEGARVVQTMLEFEVKPVIMGKDPAFPRRIRAELWKTMN
jgi:L-alanine-DL-glutamate epimerase-like enolase superfamily enzyme